MPCYYYYSETPFFATIDFLVCVCCVATIGNCPVVVENSTCATDAPHTPVPTRPATLFPNALDRDERRNSPAIRPAIRERVSS